MTDPAPLLDFLADLTCDLPGLRSRLAREARAYVYVLHRPDGSPFYVGKGVRGRCLHHEAEARTTRRLTHKLNVIRAIQRHGGAVHYRLDSFHDDELDALARERELIRTIGRHDLGLGPLTNQTDGGEGTSNPSEESRERRRQSLWGDEAEDEERRVANRFFQTLTQVRSVPIKAAGAFRAEALWANRTGFAMSARQASAIIASAIANRVLLETGALVPRRLAVDGVELVIENGVGRDMLSSGMVTIAHAAPGAEILQLTAEGCSYVIATGDRPLLLGAGVLDEAAL